jgi:hypothetical protein
MNDAPLQNRPCYTSRALPPYSYVPGFNHHPVSHPAGHMHGHAMEPAAPLEAAAWQASEEYRRGIDLFNHGYYWESHEAWESLWHAAGRRGPIAVWLKALIKLAAAAVKLREGNAPGAIHHARRSLELQAELQSTLPAGEQDYCGVALSEVKDIATSLLHDAQLGLDGPAPLKLLNAWIRLRK